MNRKNIAGGAAVAAVLIVAAAAGLTLSDSDAVADTSACTSAKSATVAAQTAFDDAFNVAKARAAELGFDAAAQAKAQAALNDGVLTEAEKADLLSLWANRDTSKAVDLVNDLPKVQAVLDLRLKLNAAQAAENVACGEAAATSTSAVTDGDDSSSSVVAPSKAPAAGDGSVGR